MYQLTKNKNLALGILRGNITQDTLGDILNLHNDIMDIWEYNTLIHSIILDLAQVVEIDSYGLNALVKLHTLALSHNKDFILYKPSTTIINHLEQISATTFFHILNCEDEFKLKLLD